MKASDKKNLLPIILFLLLLIGPTVAWGVLSLLSIENPAIMETLDFDLGEKRKKATFSNVITADNITYEIEKVYNDRIPFRSILITCKNSIDTFIEKPYKQFEQSVLKMISDFKRRDSKVQADKVDGVIRLYMDDAVDMYLDHGLKPGEVDPYIEGVNYPVKYMSENVIIGQSNWLFLNFSNQQYYRGEINIKPEELPDYIKPYESIRDLLELKGKQFVILVCPEKEEIYSEYMPTVEIIDPIEKPIKIRDYVATASTLNYLYPKEELLKSTEKYRTYMKYDSHWSDVGGYLAWNEVKKKLGLEVTPLRDLRIKKTPEEAKDLLFFGGGDRAAYPDGFQYAINYKPEVNIAFAYSDKTLEKNVTQITSDAKDQREVLLLGDSYRNAMYTFLVKDFGRVTSCAYNHMDNVVVDNAIRDADIIIFEAVERNEGITIPEMCQRVYKILTK